MKLPCLPKACTLEQDTGGPYYRMRQGGCGPGTHLQDPATDVPVAGLTLDAKLGMIVRLAVWDAIPLGEGREGCKWWVSWPGNTLTAALAPRDTPSMASTAKPVAGVVVLTC